MRTISLAILALGISGCMLPVAKTTWHDRLRASQVSRVAILPLENLSDDPHASKVVSSILSSALYGAKRFDIMEHREAVRRLDAMKVVLSKPTDLKMAVKAGKALGVQGVFFGTITEFMYLFYPQDAVVGIQLYLVDLRTEKIVWSGFFNDRNRGLVQGSDEPISDLARQGVSTLVSQLAPPIDGAPGRRLLPGQTIQAGDSTARY